MSIIITHWYILEHVSVRAGFGIESNPHYLRHTFLDQCDIGFGLLGDLFNVVYTVDEWNDLYK